MSMNKICDDCMNRFHCIIDASAGVQRCAMYNQQPDFSMLFDIIADKVADKVIERMRAYEQKNGGGEPADSPDEALRGEQRFESGDTHSSSDG